MHLMGQLVAIFRSALGAAHKALCVGGGLLGLRLYVPAQTGSQYERWLGLLPTVNL